MSTPTPSRPTHELFSVCKLRDGKSRWTKIGTAWPHKDGSGFSFVMTASVAPGGSFVMRRIAPKPSFPV